MIASLLFIGLLLILSLAFILYTKKFKNTDQENNRTEYKYVLILKQALAIFFVTIISGSFLYAGFKEIVDKGSVADFFGMWAMFSLYGTIYAIIPAMLALTVLLSYIHKLNLPASKRIYAYLLMGFLVTITVVVTTFALFRTMDILYLEIPFMLTGIISCTVIPQYIKSK